MHFLCRPLHQSWWLLIGKSERIKFRRLSCSMDASSNFPVHNIGSASSLVGIALQWKTSVLLIFFSPYFYFLFLCILYKKLNLPILKSIQFQFQEMILVHGWRLGQSLNKYNYWYLDRQAIAMLKYSSFIRRNKYKYHNRWDDTKLVLPTMTFFLSRKKFYQGHHSTENTPYI